MPAQNTAITYLGASLNTGNTNITTLSTGTIGRFSSLSNAIVTSNIVISNAATSPNYLGYALTSSNAGIRVVSPQTGGIFLSNPSGPIAEVLFNTVGNGGTISAVGVDSAARGAFWFVNGNDMINIGTNNLSIKNNFAINTSHTLYVNGSVGAASTVTITGGGLQVISPRTTDSIFYSTNLTMLNGNFLQSNANSVTSFATFFSTAMTVHGSISTTGTLLCLGRFNTPNVANVSTLSVGNNITSTAKVSLDVNGSLRTGVQKFVNVSGSINVNGGNLIYASNTSGDIYLTIPETDGAEVGTFFNIHTDIVAGRIILSTSGADFINTAGNHTSNITKARDLVSLFCYEAGSWHSVSLA
jgi:hypothetical protein